jgi:hypothetical protein
MSVNDVTDVCPNPSDEQHQRRYCKLVLIWIHRFKSVLRRGRDRMVVWFTTIYAISVYHHWCCEFESRSGRGVQHYVIGRWFSPGPPVSATNKTDHHDIAEISLKVALETIKQSWKGSPNMSCTGNMVLKEAVNNLWR